MNQKSIETYVRSSPLGPIDIHWRNINKDGQPIEEPEVLKSRIINRSNGRQATINSLINDTKPSFILARYEGKILLEITGLEASKERSYKLGRRITEVVLWVGNDSPETEARLRKLAACALLSLGKQDSPFLKTIREAVRFEGLNDFRVDQLAIERLTAQPDVCPEILSQAALVQSNPAVWSSSESINNDEHLRSLARQISQIPLPEPKQPVVIVAEIKNERFEYRGNMWEAPAAKVPPLEAVISEPEKKTTQTTQTTQTIHPKPTLIPRILVLGLTATIVALIIALMSLQIKPSMETTSGLTAPLKLSPAPIMTSKPKMGPTLKPEITPLKPTSNAKTILKTPKPMMGPTPKLETTPPRLTSEAKTTTTLKTPKPMMGSTPKSETTPSKLIPTAISPANQTAAPTPKP